MVRAAGGRPGGPGAHATIPPLGCRSSRETVHRDLVTTAATVAGLVLLTAAEAMHARHRYGRAPSAVPVVDVTAEPRGGVVVEGATTEIAAFGDSAMAGVGVADAVQALPAQIAQRVADATGRRVHVVGYAVSGARTRDVRALQLPALRQDPDVSVLVVGTNDVTHMARLDSLQRETEALLDALTGSGRPVVMSSLPEFRAMRALGHPLRGVAHGYGSLVRQVHRRAAAGRSRVTLVDVCGSVGWEFVTDPATMSADRFHPSARGYGRIADAMAPAVVAALTSTSVAGEAR
ncbi:MAG: hypothetical protein B7X41_12595 [Microbacterium sp. 14-71-5]|nr:MAG: hypothetical protein B7X41_12595 [Microbacterium sp. 14-71-5]